MVTIIRSRARKISKHAWRLFGRKIALYGDNAITYAVFFLRLLRKGWSVSNDKWRKTQTVSRSKKNIWKSIWGSKHENIKTIRLKPLGEFPIYAAKSNLQKINAFHVVRYLNHDGRLYLSNKEKNYSNISFRKRMFSFNFQILFAWILLGLIAANIDLI